MVDFNSQATISTPPGDILKIAILERRAFFINAYEQYIKANKLSDGYADDHVVAAAIISLFLEIEPSYSKDQKDNCETMREIIFHKDTGVADYLESFRKINTWLYSKNLTKFDTRKEVDSQDLEAVNVSKGL